jgi:hypothetical protein
MFQLDPSVFGNIKSKADYDRQKAMLMAQSKQRGQASKLGDLQIAQAEKALNTPKAYDTQEILAAAIQAGGVENLPPELQAQLQAADIAQRAKQSVNPMTGEIISNRSYYDLMGASPSQVLNQSPSIMQGRRPDSGMVSPTMQTVQNTGGFQDIASMPDLPMDGLPADLVDPIMMTPNVPNMSPRTKQMAQEELVKADLERQGKTIETSKAKEGVSQTIGSMADQYRKLQSLDGITSTQRPLSENVFISATETNPLAQKVQKLSGSETQTARQVIEASRARLMQDIKKATGMSAQEVNSIPEMQLLKESISDPTMTVEAVEQILGNLENRFGLGNGVSIRDSAPIRKKYNPATGMLE